MESTTSKLLIFGRFDFYEFQIACIEFSGMTPLQRSGTPKVDVPQATPKILSHINDDIGFRLCNDMSSWQQSLVYCGAVGAVKLRDPPWIEFVGNVGVL